MSFTFIGFNNVILQSFYSALCSVCLLTLIIKWSLHSYIFEFESFSTLYFSSFRFLGKISSWQILMYMVHWIIIMIISYLKTLYSGQCSVYILPRKCSTLFCKQKYDGSLFISVLSQDSRRNSMSLYFSGCIILTKLVTKDKLHAKLKWIAR